MQLVIVLAIFTFLLTVAAHVLVARVRAEHRHEVIAREAERSQLTLDHILEGMPIESARECARRAGLPDRKPDRQTVSI